MMPTKNRLWLLCSWICFALAIALLLCAAAHATTTTGTAGSVYAGGSVTAILTSPGGPTPVITATGQNFSSTNGPATLDTNGAFSLNLVDNTTVSPANTKWQFTVCAASPTSGQCFTTTAITISGGSQDISVQLLAAAPALTNSIVVARFDQLALQADLGTTTVYTAPVTAMYRMSCYLVVTQAATTSSTLPACDPVWTDAETSTLNVNNGITVSSTGNTVGITNSARGSGSAGLNAGSVVFRSLAGTAIRVTTAGYASTGATPMQFSLHVKIEFLGI